MSSSKDVAYGRGAPPERRDSLGDALLETAMLDVEPSTEPTTAYDPFVSNHGKSAAGELWYAVLSAGKKFGRTCIFVAAHIAVIPVIGAIYVYGGRYIRDRPGMTPDDNHDWQVITVIGFVMQVALMFPVYCVTQYDRFVVVPKAPPIPDWYGGIIIYCLTAVIMARIAHTFYVKVRSRKRELGRLSHSTQRASHVVKTRRAVVEDEIRIMREQAQRPTWTVVAIVVVLSLIEVITIRIIAAPWKNKSSWDDREEFYTLATIFWFLLFYVVNCIVALGLAALMYQLRLIDQFAMKRTERDLTDIRDPQLVVTWCEIWQGIILREVNTNPVSKSLTFWGSLYSLLLAVVCTWYLIMLFIYRNVFSEEVRDFRAGASLVLVYSFLTTVFYIAATVLMQRKIELQHRNVATVYHKLQVRIDDVRAGRIPRDPDDLELLHGKARVVHSLDRLLLTADPRARLFDASLESLRWVAVNAGLAFVNLYLGVILYSKCVNKTSSGAD